MDVINSLTAPKKLKAHRDGFEEIFRHSSLPMLLHDPKGDKFVDINRAALKVYGFSRQDFLKLGLSDIHASSHGRYQEHRRKDGVRIQVQVSAQRIRHGSQDATLMVVQPITQRMVQRTLTEKPYIGASSKILLGLDGKGRVTRINNNGLRLLGYKISELMGMDWFETCVVEEERVSAWQDFKKLKVGKLHDGRVYENSVLTKKGERITILWHHQPLKILNGQHLAVLSIGEDITAHVKLEKALQIALAKYKTLFECIPMGIMVADNRGKIIEVNRMAEELLGLPGEVQTLRKIDSPEWHFIYPDGTDMPVDEFPGTRALGGKKQLENNELGFVKPDADVIWLNVHAAPIPIAGSGVVLAFHDLTGRRKMEKELQEANRLLKQALQREQELAQIDMLTGVKNRRSLYEIACREFEVAQRYKQQLALILFDIDNFKKVNDTFGHTVGDQVLVQVAQTVRSELRAADLIGRFGGEEFIILLPMTDARHGFMLAERIRKQVASLQIPAPGGVASVTISSGVVGVRHTADENFDAVIRRADALMYAAKRSGKNRTYCETHSPGDSA